MTRRIAVVAACVLGLAACANQGAEACAKARECCHKVKGLCDSVNGEGPGFEDRCAIGYQAQLDSLATWNRPPCDKTAEAWSDYLACLAGLECVDVAEDGDVAKCQTQATALCLALRGSGDGQCGSDWSKLSCDGVVASFKDAAKVDSGSLKPSGKVDKDDTRPPPTDGSSGN